MKKTVVLSIALMLAFTLLLPADVSAKTHDMATPAGTAKERKANDDRTAQLAAEVEEAGTLAWLKQKFGQFTGSFWGASQLNSKGKEDAGQISRNKDELNQEALEAARKESAGIVSELEAAATSLKDGSYKTKLDSLYTSYTATERSEAIDPLIYELLLAEKAQKIWCQRHLSNEEESTLQVEAVKASTATITDIREVEMTLKELDRVKRVLCRNLLDLQRERVEVTQNIYYLPLTLQGSASSGIKYEE